MAVEPTKSPMDPEVLAAAIDASPDPFFVKDAQHRWVYGNAAFLRLLGDPDAIGKDDSHFFPADQVAVFWAADDLVLKEGRVLAQEEQIGADLWALVKKWPLRLPDGGAGLAGLIYDVTDYRARALEAQKLRAAEAARSDFLATIGHELRTPLNGVLGVAALLGAASTDARQQALCEVIQRSGRHLLDLVEDMLDAARLEAGRLALDDAPFDLVAALNDPVALLRPLAEAKNLSIDLTLGVGVSGLMLGDDGRLRQVLTNLIGNAVKFTPAGGVRVSASVMEGRLRIVVEDDGPGVPEHLREAIFGRFVKVENGPARRHGGVGLGLAISHDIVGLMGGRIWVEPSSRAGGCFIVELPLREARPEALPELAPPPPRTDGGVDVMVFDDNEINRMVVEGLLRSSGYAVAAHEDAADAPSLVVQRRPRLVLMDMVMPEVDGCEAARRIRAAEASAGLARAPVIGLTARAGAEAREECLNAGMDDHLLKPIDADALAGAIQRWLAPAP